MSVITAKQIENIRKRAKDNAQKNGMFYLQSCFETLTQTRNLFFAINTLGIAALFQSSLENYTKVIFRLEISLFFGILSLIFSFFLFIFRANYYAEKEKIYVHALPTLGEYQEMTNIENNLYKKMLQNTSKYWYLSILFLIAQGLLIIAALRLF